MFKEYVKNIYLKAYKLGLKGVTVFRYGSKSEQVIYVGGAEEREPSCPICSFSLI